METSYATARPPDYTKYQEPTHLPPFGWTGDERIAFRVKFVIWPQEGQGQENNDWAICLVSLLRDEKQTLPARQAMDWDIVVVGLMPGAVEGKVYTGVASLNFNEKYGKPDRYGAKRNYSEWQLAVSGVMESEPLTINDIEIFLCTLPHIGPVRAREVTNKYGLNTLTVIREQGVMAFEGIAGLTDERLIADTIPMFIKSYDSITQSKLLGAANITGAARNRALSRYRGKDIRLVMQANPTDLLEIEGVSFAQALALWMICDLAKDDIRIIAAGLSHTIRQHEQWGNSWTELGIVFNGTNKIKGVQALLGLFDLKTRWFAENLANHEQVVPLVYVDRNGGMWRRKVWESEQRFTEAVSRLLAAKPKFTEKQIARAGEIMDRLIAEGKMKLSPKQKEVALQAFRHTVIVVTGSAGTGKTTIQKAITMVATELNVQLIRVMAPTGKAADNATRKVGIRATTIHKALELSPNGQPIRTIENPIDGEVFVVDEFGMVDMILAADFVDAISVGSHVVIVGDPAQLAAVGPGAVLRDLIDCGVVPRFHLLETYRQNPGSKLLDLLQAIRDREPMALVGTDGRSLYADIEIVNLTGPNSQAAMVEWAVKKFKEVGDPDKIKFLAYTKGVKVDDPLQQPVRGEKIRKVYRDASVAHLNETIVADLFPAINGEEVYKTGGITYRTGQRCLWLSNTNDPLFDMTNGREFDIASIWRDSETDKLWMRIVCLNAYGHTISYDMEPGLWDGDFMHGYCVTFHKAQGSEWHEVIVFIRPGDEYRLDLEAVYTALSRAADKVYIVGNLDVIWTVKPRTPYRQTGLVQKLRARIKPGTKLAV